MAGETLNCVCMHTHTEAKDKDTEVWILDEECKLGESPFMGGWVGGGGSLSLMWVHAEVTAVI